MDFVSRIDQTLSAKARETQDRIWDRIFAAFSGEWERGWSLRWIADPVITAEEVAEELRHGRE